MKEVVEEEAEEEELQLLHSLWPVKQKRRISALPTNLKETV